MHSLALQATFINMACLLPQTRAPLDGSRINAAIHTNRITDIFLFQAILSLDGDPPVLRLFEERDYK